MTYTQNRHFKPKPHDDLLIRTLICSHLVQIDGRLEDLLVIKHVPQRVVAFIDYLMASSVELSAFV